MTSKIKIESQYFSHQLSKHENYSSHNPLKISNNSYHLANADTGTTGHYISFNDATAVTNIEPLTNNATIAVKLPDDSIVRATHSANLNIPGLPLTACKAYLFPELKCSLISIGILCDHGMTAHYDKDNVQIVDNLGQIIIKGSRHQTSKLWMINISPPDQFRNTSTSSTSEESKELGSAGLAVHFENVRDQVLFQHAAFGSPVPSTFIKAITNGFIKLPGLTAKQVRLHLDVTFPTLAGHMDQQRQRPHNHKFLHLPDHDDAAHFADDLQGILAQQKPARRNGIHLYVLDTLETTDNHQAFMDLTGRFPVKSKSGNQYIMVLLTEQQNYIHLEPMKNRSSPEYVRAFQHGVNFFKSHNIILNHVRIDNETSSELEAAARDINIEFEYVAPHMHRANRAERAIRTFKNHFLATLATANPDFPLFLWDTILPQVEITLNLLRLAHVNGQPTSAWKQIHGKDFDFSAHPFAPLGIQVAIQVKPEQRTSWAFHAMRGYYLGPSLKHYRCHRVFVSGSQSERISDTLQWFPHANNSEIPGALYSFPQRVMDFAQIIHEQTISPSFTQVDAQQLPATIGALSTELRALLQSLSKYDEGRNQRVLPKADEGDNLQPLNEAVKQRVTNPKPKVLFDIIPAVEIPIAPPGLTKQPHYLRSSSPIQQQVHFSASLSLDPNAVPQPESYRAAMQGPDQHHWEQAHSEEFTRLIETTNCMSFVPMSAKPPNEFATYYNPQVKLKMKNGKLDYRVRGTVGGDRVQYEEYRSSFTASLPTVKVLLNAVVSEDAEWMTVDIKDYYLGSPMEKPVYMRIALKQIPLDIQQKYNLAAITRDGKVMTKIVKGMYGLPHAGKLAQDRLIPHLAKHGYRQCEHTRCLFTHDTRPIAFTLVVDDFGIKFKGRENAQHLLTALEELYKITIDWTGSKYLGIVIDYNRTARTISLSMPKYIENALDRFGAKDFPGADSPLVYTPPQYGLVRQQQTPDADVSAPLSIERKTRLQQITGTLLYYARAVDPTMLTAINKIASYQSNPTENVELAVNRLLSYAKKWSNASLLIKASDMILQAHSDASYLSESASRSRIGGILYLGNKTNDTFVNAAIDQFSTILNVIVSSAAEAEYAAVFTVGQEAEPIRVTLEELGYPQPATPITCDNQCAVGLSLDILKQKRSKAVDMRFHWIRDRVRQGHFTVNWQPGATNLADFFTKAHSVDHHKKVRSWYVHDPPNSSNSAIFINFCKRRHQLYRDLHRLTHTPLKISDERVY